MLNIIWLVLIAFSAFVIAVSCYGNLRSLWRLYGEVNMHKFIVADIAIWTFIIGGCIAMPKASIIVAGIQLVSAYLAAKGSKK